MLELKPLEKIQYNQFIKRECKLSIIPFPKTREVFKMDKGIEIFQKKKDLSM